MIKKKRKTKLWSLLSWRYSRIQIEQEFAKEIGWIDFLAKCSYEYINHATNQKISKFNVISTWALDSLKMNLILHWHRSYFGRILKVPQTLGNFVG